mmetsp:Transcript_12346/g.26669  ORF Transcript_12346/g.26669 Transcript_12346/m.26669 type:complete len:397 (+) Transcript_12346:362-1552(+)|eukprot:CAMPEP_0202913604 /NCGR_PEP_ID=MMETSP1392-20130828/60896_1 /ASSEMBLY_ACC=CAM_ASM_000868 /TAXON_ID=225041 /ORGANISM="Chlamydomonas chlamydogama, Strain SAG 11-48b" /LENGTH=396 /DNA_ID=CAMNT_0049604917 /DNA_START=287 /DNA_END=1477 /DNA_ORIENTATION=+
MQRPVCLRQHHKAARLDRPRSAVRQISITATIAPERPWSVNNNNNNNGSGPSTSSATTTTILQGKAVEEYAMWKCIESHQRYPKGLPLPKLQWSSAVLDDAYARCGEVTAEYAKTFYLGTQLMTPVQAKAIWAIYVWCRRTDELVDGPNASKITPKALDRWEERLEAIFEGRPYDVLDAALTDTLTQFPLDIQPFRDMIEGMRMDLVKTRYETFDELYEYCYRVAGTVGLMSMPVMGIDPSYKGPMEKVYRAALALGTANQLTNILRDVGEDIKQRNRIYVPMQELREYGISEEDLLAHVHSPSSSGVDDRWRAFMKFQIERSQQYFRDAESGVDWLDGKARWPVWSALILYRQILDAIQRNDYDNFTKRAYVPKWKKFASLPMAFSRAMMPMSKE